MLCQSCGKRTATNHIQSVVNGQLRETHLCPECAQNLGYQNIFSLWGADLGNLLGGLLGGQTPGVTNTRQQPMRQQALRCPKCGASFAEIAESGKMGCAQCYQVFRKELLPTIQKVHGATRHTGKTPTGAALQVSQSLGKLVPVEETPLQKKKRELQQAIEAQEFERAAQLRDEIKEMEKDE